MGYKEYLEAYKLGKKEFRNCVVKGRYPYLPVLDEIISDVDIDSEVNLGLVNIPLDQIVGTSTAGRTTAFASNFMPVLDWGSEFSAKWAVLADAQVEEGIRDSIKVYEYMNRFYVVEGNKRVSVLKYYGAVSIPGIVTRKVPRKTEDLENQIYYEFMDFYSVTGLNDVWFNYKGGFKKLLEHIGVSSENPWSDEDKMNFTSAFLAFKTAYLKKFEKKLNMTNAEALLVFLDIYGYEALCTMSVEDIIDSMNKCIAEFYVLKKNENLDLQMDPVNIEKKNIFSYLIPASSKKLKVAFVYDVPPEKSDWTYAHDLGRIYIENSFPDQIETSSIDYVDKKVPLEDILRDKIEDGNEIIFTTSPEMMQSSLKIAIEHPEVKILNCSLNNPHGYIRTYYARMYEAKFLTGMIAGAMADNNRIAYIADYPIYGMIANINAFALGAKMVNPLAKVYLCWSKLKDFDVDAYLKDNEISCISDQDLIVPQNASRRFGLYHINQEGKQENLAMSVWHWGVFYEKLIQSILSGSFKNEETDMSKALNYWWGMSAGVIDIICSDKMPTGTMKLIELMKQMICSGRFKPFSGIVRAQQGTIADNVNCEMTPEEIITMDWLTDNIVGYIPPTQAFVEEAQHLVEVQGVPLAKRSQ